MKSHARTAAAIGRQAMAATSSRRRLAGIRWTRFSLELHAYPRERRQLAQLAENLGVARKSLYLWLTGRKWPSRPRSCPRWPAGTAANSRAANNLALLAPWRWAGDYQRKNAMNNCAFLSAGVFLGLLWGAAGVFFFFFFFFFFL